MTNAERIMKSKAFIKVELDQTLPKAQSDELWRKATEKLASMLEKKFGPKNGFQNRFYPKETGVFRMDILACPYCRYFGELGCPELTKIYCANDDRVYGKLPGLRFERAGTLGTGADRCDFCIRKETG